VSSVREVGELGYCPSDLQGFVKWFTDELVVKVKVS
jgi:hypothetical protein